MADSTDFAPIATYPRGLARAIDESQATSEEEREPSSSVATTPSSGDADESSLSPALLKEQRNGDAPSSSSLAGGKGAGLTGETREYYCGVGPCRPAWLQRLRNAKFFTFLLCLNCFIEGALVSGFTSVILSSIERRYRLSSTSAGLIASSFDMAVLVSVIFISYFGGKGHKPRWLGFSLLVQGTGALIFALPEFALGRYEIGRSELNRFESCQDPEDFSPNFSDANQLALVFFFIGNILIGIGAAPLFTVGTSYLDDIVRPKHVSIHIGIFYTVVVVGPALGYGLGGAFLLIYVDPWISTTLTPEDPAWVGAWWLCFIFAAVVSYMIAIPFLLFPRLLPDSHLIKEEREKEMAKKYTSKYGEKEDKHFLTILKTFPINLWKVFSNLTWIFITLAVSSSIIVLAGMVSFAPKYLESQFSLTASTASLIAGGVAIPAGGAGTLAGALLVYFTKSKGRRVALIMWIIAFLAVLPALAFLVRCPTLELAGLTVEYGDGSPLGPSLNSSCVLPCNCSSTVFEPVCGADGLTYFSPCRAGCQKYFNDDIESFVFENCTCVSERLAGVNFSDPAPTLLANSTALEGRCNQPCNSLGVFLLLIAIALFLIFMLNTPVVIVTIRCVADQHRTLALGIQSLVFRLFGSIPGPIVFGVIFDSACILRQAGRKNCWVYDNRLLSQRALYLAISGIVLNFIFSFFTWVVYPKNTATEKEAKKLVSGEHESGNNDIKKPLKGTDSNTGNAVDKPRALEVQESRKALLDSAGQYGSFDSGSAVGNGLTDVLDYRNETGEVSGSNALDLHGARAHSMERGGADSPRTVLESPTPF